MKIKIPYDLRMRFLRHEGLSVTQEMIQINMLVGIPIKMPGQKDFEVELDLSYDPYSLNACIDWVNIIRTDYTPSYSLYPSYKIDVGGYIGLWPNSINQDCVVTFIMDDFNPSRKHWKDWFIIDEEEIENAPKQPNKLLSNVCNLR